MTSPEKVYGLVDGVPTLGAPGADRLPSVALTYWRIHAAISGIVAAFMVSGVLAVAWPRVLVPWGLAMSILILLFTTFEIVAYLPFRYVNYSYTVSEDFVYIAHGKILRRSVLIPATKIINVSSSQGPNMRSLRVTALGITHLLHVDGFGPFPAELAENLKVRIVARSSAQRNP